VEASLRLTMLPSMNDAFEGGKLFPV
jgi:hypothetical protein